jgi:acetate kinase
MCQWSFTLPGLTLTINSGSSSLKFGLFRSMGATSGPAEYFRGSLDGIGYKPVFQFDARASEVLPPEVIQCAKELRFASVEQAHQVLAGWLKSFLSGVHIDTVCYRVVHGGDRFQKPVEINQEVLEDIAALVPLAPLHQALALDAIEVFMASYPKAVHKACFDTAFHRTMPPVAQRFAIPEKLTAQGIKPYGFHGLSYQYIADTLKELNQGTVPQRVVVAHLGSGCSLCAFQDGVSIETTMTFTPLDGLPMATRCGSIDPGAVLYMGQKLNMSFEEISRCLHQDSGMKALSGISGDMRDLLRSDSAEAQFAVDFFVYRICREIGSLIAPLKGLDALVFTGGVGAHGWQIREQVCVQLGWLNATIDPIANRENRYLISAPESMIKLYALKTDEEFVMARLTHSLW